MTFKKNDRMDSKQVLNDALIKIKTDYEMAIKNGGNEEKNSAIRSSNIINNIHEFIKQEFINNSISPSKIHPAKSKTKPELELSGFLKTKKQDIAVIPSSPKKETITYNSEQVYLLKVVIVVSKKISLNGLEYQICLNLK